MRTLIIFLALTISINGSELQAADKNTASLQVKEKAAKKACAIGEYQKGIEVLADLYVDTNDPTYVFNQGRCYQQNSRFEQAIERFREFLRKMPALSNEEKAGVENHIADCEELLRKSALASKPSPNEASSPPPSQTILLTENPSAENIAASAPASSNAGSGMRIMGLVSIGVGLAATAAGVYWNLQAQNLSNDIHSPESGTYADKDREQGKYKKLSLVGYGVGAAAILTGTILYIVGQVRHTDESTNNDHTLTATFAPGSAGLIFRGGF